MLSVMASDSDASGEIVPEGNTSDPETGPIPASRHHVEHAAHAVVAHATKFHTEHTVDSGLDETHPQPIDVARQGPDGKGVRKGISQNVVWTWTSSIFRLRYKPFSLRWLPSKLQLQRELNYAVGVRRC